MNKKLLYPLLVLAGGAILAILLATSKPVVESEPIQPMITTVRVLKVEPKTEYLTVSSQGSVQPRTQSTLIPEVSGRVTWISPSLVGGGSFKQGDVLLKIDRADYLSNVERSRAVVQRSEVEHSFTGDELNRLEKLFKKKLASQSQLDEARRNDRVAQANLLEGRANLTQAERDLSRTELTAPFDGLVRSEQVDKGQFVSRGTSIGIIYATDFVEVRLPIAASQLQFMGLPTKNIRGQIPPSIQPPVTLTADIGTTKVIWEAVLVRAEAEIDEQSRMLYGVVRLPSMRDEQSLPIPVGLFVQAEIRGQKVENLIQLPRSAVRDGDQVLVVDSDNRLHYRNVRILRLQHDDVLISEGLEAGELVCISPLQAVVDGMLVNPIIE
jgi:RND family efflux transporter MFP subunit